jgi:uridine kinase
MSLVIGIAGGSGSGKTTVVRRIVDALGGEHVTVLDHDRYYRDHPELRLEERAALNYDHPDSLDTGLMVEHVHALKAGRPIDAPIYDFTRHARAAATERLDPRTALIVEGILVFGDKRLRRVDGHQDFRRCRR